MNIKTSQKLKKNILRWLVIPVLGGFVIALFNCDECFVSENYDRFIVDAVVSSIFWSVLYNGNVVMSGISEKHWKWLEEPLKRLVGETVLILSFSISSSIFIIFVLVEGYFGLDFWQYASQEGWFGMLVVPLSITATMVVVLQGRDFLFSWRQAAINVEKLKNENLATKLESLKNQVNPHFLFNSLNALSSLVYSDQEKAVDFIQKLSGVYRYILDHQNDEVVDLLSEIELVKSFVFLNQIRFGKNLTVDYSKIEVAQGEYLIPPMTLQMLLENCFKHNEISKENKLNVSIYRKGESLIVTNNMNPLSKPKRDSSKIGLSNIISRYELFTSRTVQIDSTDEFYAVSIPLLKIQDANS